MDRFQAYSILGLSSGAGEDEVKSAYRTLAHKYSVDNYESGPLRDDAEAKMTEINEAFDVLMSFLRTGQETPSMAGPQGGSTSSSHPSRYKAIRQLISNGQIDEALAELSAITDGSQDAEWNFLMGSAYYYKGWLDQALSYFQQAVKLQPGNREYEAALRNLSNSREGNMQGNPYGPQAQDAAALNCACNTCSLMCCLDACCGGFCR